MRALVPDDCDCIQVLLRELACVRFTVWDSAAQSLLAQRVVPLRYLRLGSYTKPAVPRSGFFIAVSVIGYRHLRLRCPQDNVLEVATLFIRTRASEENSGVDGWSLQKFYNATWLGETNLDLAGQDSLEVTTTQDVVNDKSSEMISDTLTGETSTLEVISEDTTLEEQKDPACVSQADPAERFVSSTSSGSSSTHTPNVRVVFYDL